MRRAHAPWLICAAAAGLLAVWLAASPAVQEKAAARENNVISRTDAVLMAVGDIMVHTPQLPAYYDKETRQYDFSPWFERVSPLLQQGDWVIANLETPLAGADLKYTGYPRFNAPAELAGALRSAGFDLVSTANNHAMDRGFAGIQRTLRSVRAAGLIPVGTAEDAVDAGRLTLLERRGIKMGFAAYTFGTNGIPVPEDKSFAVSLIDEQRMASDFRRLREAGAEIISVSLHFGTEYQRMPSEEQRRIARSAVGAGADIVLGSHPHVVQPWDVIEVPASESALQVKRKGVVIYSLGNFISNQTGDWTDIGLIFGLHLTKTRFSDGSTVTELGRVETTPTWVHIAKTNGKRHYTILPLARTLTARDDPTLTSSDYKNMKAWLVGIEKHLKS